MSDAAQIELLCPGCAGQRAFDPISGTLKCVSCGNTEDLSTDQDTSAANEFPYDPDAPVNEPICAFDTAAHHCKTCGGDVTFTGAALSERCPYCDGPVVRAPADIAFETMALVPFGATQENAETWAKDWTARRWAAPADLMGHVKQGRIAGLYAPFWTFDSQEALQYWAMYRQRSGKRTHTRKISGRMRIAFNDLLVPASHHVTPLIRDGILHAFDPYSLKPFRPGYLAGFADERHHQSVSEGLRANAADKDLLIRNRIKQDAGKSGLFNITYRTDTSGIHYRRILLPVWILHYHYKDKPMKIVVSGIDGRTYGERPFSVLKLMGYAAALSGLALTLGIAWGAMGLL